MAARGCYPPEERRGGATTAVRDTARRKLTYEDYLLFPEDGKRHEVLDGEHYGMPAPSLGHQEVLGNLHLKLAPFVRERRLGRVYLAAVDVLLSPHDIAQPDLLFVSNERAGILNEANVSGAPDLVVEILSDSTRRRDETLKRDLYGRFGVREYWLVDRQRRTLRVFRRQGPGFGAPQELSAAADDRLTTPLLPGLEISLREIFEAS